MKIPNWIPRAGAYLLARLQEPSTYRGLVLVIGAGSWAALDSSNRGELIMQGALLLAGVIQAVVPQSALYKVSPKA
jgi:hypothetical protein